jgi:hypothetical protein
VLVRRVQYDLAFPQCRIHSLLPSRGFRHRYQFRCSRVYTFASVCIPRLLPDVRYPGVRKKIHECSKSLTIKCVN